MEQLGQRRASIALSLNLFLPQELVAIAHQYIACGSICVTSQSHYYDDDDDEDVGSLVYVYDQEMTQWRLDPSLSSDCTSPYLGWCQGQLWSHGLALTESANLPCLLRFHDGKWQSVLHSPSVIGPDEQACSMNVVGDSLYFNKEDRHDSRPTDPAIPVFVKYDCKRKLRSSLPGMSCPRSDVTSVSVGDSIYVFGGRVHRRALSSCEKFDVLGNAWHSLPPMKTARFSAAAAFHPASGIIYVLGGTHVIEERGDHYHSGRKVNLTSIERFDIVTQQWLSEKNFKGLIVPLPLSLHHHSAAILGDDLFVIGGHNVTELPSIWKCCLTDRPSTWTLALRLSRHFGSTSATTLFFEKCGKSRLE